MSVHFCTGGEDENGDLFGAEFGCDECGTFYSWPVTPGLAPSVDPLQKDMLALVAMHTEESCQMLQAAEDEDARLSALSPDYEFFESLGSHHPVEVGLTVAQCEKQERAGYPLPVGGDPETCLAHELLEIDRERYPRPAPAGRRAKHALAAIQERLMIGGRLVCRSDNTDAGVAL